MDLGLGLNVVRLAPGLNLSSGLDLNLRFFLCRVTFVGFFGDQLVSDEAHFFVGVSGGPRAWLYQVRRTSD